MDGPIMRADDEERSRVYKLSAEQKKAFAVMTIIQLAMIVITFALFAVQMITNIKVGVCCIASIIIFMVVYLNFLKLASYVADCGIKVGWVRAIRVLSPILFFVAFILCIITLV